MNLIFNHEEFFPMVSGYYLAWWILMVFTWKVIHV